MSEFAATRWTLVSQAKGDDATAKSALSELCEAYYAPVVAFLRAGGREEDAARELAHEFFARILGGQSLAGADAARGRFRAYLLGAVKHFVSDRRDRDRAGKRGGGAEAVPLDTSTAAGLNLAAPADAQLDRAFDRQWALTIIARAMDAVGAELRDAGKGEQFDVLKPWLIGTESPALSQANASRMLGIGEGAVKVAIHRLRHRFREAVKAEIAETVPADSDIDDELGHLVAVLVTA